MRTVTRAALASALIISVLLLWPLSNAPSTATVGTGVVNTLDYGTDLDSGGAHCWRGYAFQVSMTTTMTHIVGGANNTSSPGLFQGALFAGTQNANGSFTVGSVLRQVDFPQTVVTGNDRGRVSVKLAENYDLQPGNWYILAQGRTGSNSSFHYFVRTLDVPDLIAASVRIADWQPQANNAFIFGCNETIAQRVGMISATTDSKVAVGFRFLSDATLPVVETLDTPLTGRLTDRGNAPTALYLEYSTSSTMADPVVVLDQAGYEGDVPYTYSSSAAGLSAGTTYFYRARAINDAGQITGAIKQFTTPSPPAAPSITSAAPGAGSATLVLSFPDPSEVTNVQYSLDGGAWISRSPASASPELLITGLTDNVQYSIRVRSVNQGIIGAESAPTNVTPGLTPPTVISEIAGTITATTASLAGDVTSDGGASVDARGVVISSDESAALVTSGGDPAVRTVSIGDGTGAFSATVAELEPATTYRFRAFAANSQGTAYGSVQTFTTPPVIVWRDDVPASDGSDDAYAAARAALALGPIVGQAFSVALSDLTAGGGGGAQTFTVAAGALPTGLSLAADGSLEGTVTSEALVGETFTATIEVAEPTSGTTASRSFTFTVTTFGTLRTTDYGTAPTSGGAFCWRGYAFRTSSETIVTGLIGGGTIAYNVTNEFRGALYSANVDGSGNPTSVGAVLADVRFPDNNVNQRIALDEPVTLAPDTWYFLMQGRVTGSVLHWYVQSLDAGDLVAASARMSAWLPSIGAPGQAFFGACGGPASGNVGRSVGGTLGTTGDKPAVGLEFLTTSKPPQVTTVGLVDGVMTGELDAGSPGAVGYIQHGTSIDSGSRLDLIGGRTGGQTFGLPLSGVSGISGATYSFRARAINDAGAANGATIDITTKAQTLTGWSFPSELSGGVVYGHGTISIPGVATSASGTATATPTVTSTTTGVCTVSSSASGGSRDVTVTIVGAGACTLRASHPGGWDGTALYRSIQSDITLNVAPLPIGIRGSFTVQARTYDGTTVATIAANDLLPDPDVRIGADVISLTGITLAFDAPDVGSRSVSITSAALTGAHASRYALTIVGAPTASGEITAIPLTVTGGSIAAADKVYDGTDVAVVTPSGLTLSGFASGDSMADITWEPAGRFTTTPVDSGITVELVGGAVFGGPKGANYTLDVTGAPTASASITPRPVTVTGASAAARPYDGTTVVSIGGASLANVVAGDALTLANATSGVAASRDAGSQAVSTSMTLAGAAASNYRLVGQPSLSVTITPLPVAVTMNALPARAYDGTSAVALTPAAFSVSGVLPGESIGVSGTAQLSSRSPGTRTVTLAAPTFTPGAGTNLANYTLPSSVTGSVTVTPLTLRITGATVTERTWDGTTTATITGARLDGLRAGDNVSLTGATSGVFASSQPGTHPVRFTPTLAGVDAINYTLVVPELTGTIARAPASLRITGGLTQFADGSPRTVRAAVSPASAGRAVVTYPGGTAPSAPGSYPVTVTLDSATHTAEPLSVTLTISPLDALVLPTSPTPTTPVDDARRAEVLARIAVRTDGTLALPEIGPVLEADGTAPAFTPREHRVLEDGEPTTARIVVVEDQRVRIETDDDTFSIELQAAVATDDGRIPLPVDADGTLLLDRGGLVEVGGSGFLPGSTAEVWMFSEATFLGTAIVGPDGTFSGAFPVDDLLAPGEHTIQLNGTGADQQVRSTSLGVRIDDPEAPTRERVVITAASDTTSSSGPLWLLALAALLGAAIMRWWIVGRRRRDDEDDEDRIRQHARDTDTTRERTHR